MAEIQVQSDFVVNGAVVLNKNETDFPANPRIGTLVIKDKVLYGYLEIGSLQTWYPFSTKSNSYIHSQGGANVTWTINHNLNSTNLFVQILDSSGNIITAAKQTVNNNTFRLLFTEAVTGTVLVVAPDTIDVPLIKSTLIEVGPNVTIDTSGLKVNGAYALTSASIASDIASAVNNDVTYANVRNKPNTVAGYDITDAYTKTAVDSAIANVSNALSTQSGDFQNDIDAINQTLAGLANVATSGSYTDLSNKPTLFSGSYADLSGKPTLATVATSGDYGDLTGKPTLFSGSYADLTNKPNLATLAGSNSQDFSTANLFVNGDILPAVTGVSNIGSPTRKFNSIYTEELRIDANTLYVDGVPVLGSSANTITFTADVNQGMRIATTGTGTLVLASNAATTVQSTGQNADVIIQTSGQGGQTRVTSATQVTLTSPTVAVVGDQTVSGNMTVSGEFTVRGNVTTIESTVTSVKDNIITVNKGQQGSGVSLNVAGIDVDRGDLARQRLLWNEALGKWVVGPTTQEVALATEAFVASSITGKANTSSLATVATSGSYADLSNKPTLFSGSYTDLTNKPALFSGAYADLSGKPTLATVASSGDYGDLVNKPSLAAVATAGTFASLTSKPTTISGYGIVDAYTMAQANSYVTTAISAVVNGAPGALDTLNEIAAALGNDANLSATLTTLIASKANTSSLAAVATAGTFASLTSKPTTISGYGITDAYTMAQANVQIALKANVAAETTVNAATDAATASTLVRRDATGSFSGNVITAINFNTTSDARFKSDIVTIEDAIGLVEQLRGVSFNWVDTGAPTIGLIAQEVEQVLPELVSTDDEGYKSVAYSNMVGVLIEAIKEQQAQIDELREMVLNLSK